MVEELLSGNPHIEKESARSIADGAMMEAASVCVGQMVSAREPQPGPSGAALPELGVPLHWAWWAAASEAGPHVLLPAPPGPGPAAPGPSRLSASLGECGSQPRVAAQQRCRVQGPQGSGPEVPLWPSCPRHLVLGLALAQARQPCLV